MGNKWKKLKQLFGIKVRASASPSGNDNLESFTSMSAPQGRVLSSEPMTPFHTGPIHRPSIPSFHSGPIQSTSHTTKLRSSKNMCSICLESMKAGSGHALFTAECSHTFHFSCIASSVRFGNLVCPVCRAKWKEVPWQKDLPSESSKTERSRSGRRGLSAIARSFTQIGRSDMRRSDTSVPSLELDQRLSGPQIRTGDHHQHQHQHHHHGGDSLSEPDIYNDDEPLPQQLISPVSDPCSGSPLQTHNSESPEDYHKTKTQAPILDLSVSPEVSVVPALEAQDNFLLLVHLKAPPPLPLPLPSGTLSYARARAPIDLVTVLDVSGSMAGKKLALLKRAMGFVVCNLSSADRLSIVAFSSSARRVFPLRRMVEEGRQQALRAIDGLTSSGGTNIADGLRKGAKVLEDRREKNPVATIMLLSDGQDTYTTMNIHRQVPFFIVQGGNSSYNGRRLVPGSIRNSSRHGQVQIPVHTFGFGSDHDAATMHTISEVSGGTFSFVQRESGLQDAFAQCIGGLLSVVAQDVQLTVSCSSSDVSINKIHAGSYSSSILENGRHGIIKLGDLYAEEERHILVEVKLPVCLQPWNGEPMPLIQAGCMYKDPITQEINQNIAEDLSILRPEALLRGEDQVPSLQVDRQRNRFNVADAISKAKSMADEGRIEAAQEHLQRAQEALKSSMSARSGDQLCNALELELNEIQGRMASRQVYETLGRAYILSAQSSHMRQRATTRGDAQDGQNHDYQTSSMVGLVHQSQTLSSSSTALAFTPGAFPRGAIRVGPQHQSPRNTSTESQSPQGSNVKKH